jgi:hypothetical protein
MSKTITLLVDDDVYHIIKAAAEGDRRAISNFLEKATLSYITEGNFVSDEEMNELLNDKALVKKLSQGREQIMQGRFSIVD